MKKEKNICVEEVAKVPVVEYYFYRKDTNGYLKTDGGLVYVSVTAISIDFKKQLLVTTLTDKSGKEYLKEGKFSLYASPEAYEADDPMRMIVYQTWELLKFADWGRLTDCAVGIVDEEEGKQSCYIKVWVFEDGGAKEIPVVINSIACDTYEKWHLTDGNIPVKIWETRADAYACNEYQITDSDGEVFTEEGFQKRLGLTPAQWVILKQMKVLFDKATDAGIRFIWDREYAGNIKAVNLLNVHDYGYDQQAFQGGDNIQFKQVVFADTGINFYDYNSDDADRETFALNPTARQQKEWLKATQGDE